MFARPVPVGITYATAPGTDLKAVLREFADARADMFVRPDGKVTGVEIHFDGQVEEAVAVEAVEHLQRRGLVAVGAVRVVQSSEELQT